MNTEILGMIIGSSALFSFIQYLITRSDNKRDDEYVKESEMQEVRDKVKRIDDDVTNLKESNRVILNSLYALLEHAKTSNNTGGMAEAQKDIFEFLNK